jgi:hypothetical protein
MAAVEDAKAPWKKGSGRPSEKSMRIAAVLAVLGVLCSCYYFVTDGTRLDFSPFGVATLTGRQVDVTTHDGLREGAARLAAMFNKTEARIVSFQYTRPADVEFVYLKLHKVGGSTLSAILERNGLRGNLSSYTRPLYADQMKRLEEKKSETRRVWSELGLVWGSGNIPAREVIDSRTVSHGHALLPIAEKALAATRQQRDQGADTYRSALEEQCLYDRHLHLWKSGARIFVIAVFRHPVAQFESLFYYVTRNHTYSLNQFYTILEMLKLREKVLPHLQSQLHRGNVQQAMEKEERMNTTFFQKLTADFHAHVAAEASRRDIGEKLLSMQLMDMDEKMWRTCFGRLDHEYSTYLSAEHVDALDFVGITERFDASLALLCKMLNMPAVSCSFRAVV